MNIYLDTNLWNELCDQHVDAEHLITSLDVRNAGLVLRHHAVYELARCFLSSAKTGPERGRVLFSYLSVFTRRNIRCTNEILGVLSAEMWALRRQEPSIRFWAPRRTAS